MMGIVKDKRLSTAYEIIMALLALIAVTISFMNFTGRIAIESSEVFYYTDMCILLVFALDYIIRLIYSKDKMGFLVNNLLDLIAIIPFNSFFRAFRFARLLRFTRFIKLIRIAGIMVLFKRFVTRLDGFFKTNGFVYVLYLTFTTMVLGSFGIYYFEFGKTINSFGDALWWSFVTATTVGYGDISPVTTPGRIIAAVLMLTGIGFIGMLTGTIATFFISMKKTSPRHIQKQNNIDMSDLNSDEYGEVLRFIEFVKSKR